MSKTVSIDGLADAVMKELENYSTLQTQSMKRSVQKVATKVRKQISSNAPVLSGSYKGSWATRKTIETPTELEITVYSKKGYLPHLLEHGHALRNGGRASAREHIKPAEDEGAKELESEIRRNLSHG